MPVTASRDDVGSYVCAKSGQRLDVAVGMNVQADIARQDAQRFHERRH